MLALEDKLKAVDLVHNGMSYRQAAKACGIAHSSIWKWDRCLKGDASDLYALVAGKRREDGLMDLENLPDDPDELKRIIYDMQFEMDLRDEVAKILKKRPRRSPEELEEQGEGPSGGRLGEEEDIFDWMDAVMHRAYTSDFLLSQEEDRKGPGKGAQSEGDGGRRRPS